MDNHGSAMISAIVAGVVMSAFAMSLILVSYTLYAQMNNRTTQIQCEYLAKEVCEEISDELSNKKSDMFLKLNKQVYRVSPEGIPSGVWAPKGNNKSEYFDTLEYELDTKNTDNGLNGYKIYVDFTYVLNDAGSELDADIPDDVFDEVPDAPDEKWYEMDKNSSASTGNATVYAKVTCKKGTSVYTAAKALFLNFD